MTAQDVHLGIYTEPFKPGLPPIHESGSVGPKLGNLIITNCVSAIENGQRPACVPPCHRVGSRGGAVHQISHKPQIATNKMARMLFKRPTELGAGGHAGFVSQNRTHGSVEGQCTGSPQRELIGFHGKLQ